MATLKNKKKKNKIPAVLSSKSLGDINALAKKVTTINK